MESFDRLVISLLDTNAIKGCYKKELAKALNVPVSTITDVWLETELIDGVATQMLKVSFVDAKIDKKHLMDLNFKYIYENCIVFEVGDVFL